METFKAAINIAVGLAFGAVAVKSAKLLWGLVQDEEGEHAEGEKS